MKTMKSISCSWIICLFCLLIHFVDAEYDRRGCTAVKYAYRNKGFSAVEVPAFMARSEDLKICPMGYSCCTTEMEENLNHKSQEEFDSTMANKINQLRSTFISRSAKFDEFFTELLENAKQDLHNMFVKTYGLLYQQNSYLFTDLFQELTSYYKGSDLNLADVLDSFFSRLLERMFVLLHQAHQFDDTYLECVTSSMDQLKPFGDVPHRLTQDIKRAFIAARTFVQGLQIGRDVVIAVSKLEPSKSCRQAMMKMTYCPYCSGQPYVKPCQNLCLNVIKGCLSNHADLHEDWDKYLDGLLKLADKLERHYNIETVVDPIDVKISDAIMNFQDNANTITDKVYEGCGRPPYGRNKRSPASSYDDTSFNFNYAPGSPNVRPTTAAGTSLDRLVRDIKEKVSSSKGFWHSLSGEMCADLSGNTQDSDCWNGMSVGSYLPDVVRDGLTYQMNNPEVDVDVRYPNGIIQHQTLQLRLITNKLENALWGIDVDWIDSADDGGWSAYPVDQEHSGSGVDDERDYSGSGWDTDDGTEWSHLPYNPPVMSGGENSYDKDPFFDLYPPNKKPPQNQPKNPHVYKPAQGGDPGPDVITTTPSRAPSLKSTARVTLLVTVALMLLWDTWQN